ncbi:unnamed protein product [Scytosiphon promiscuus]
MEGGGGGGGIGGGINFIGADGSVLDKLPSGMEMVMDSEAMCSLDYGLGSLATLSPAPDQETQGRQQQQEQQQQLVKVEEEERRQQQQPYVSAADGWSLHSTLTPSPAAATGGAAAKAALEAKAEVRPAAGKTQSSPTGQDHDGSRYRGDNDDEHDTAQTGGIGGDGGGEAHKNNGGSIPKGPKARVGKKRKKEDDGGGGGGDGGAEGDVYGDADGEADDGGGKGAGEMEDPNENPKQKANRVRNREHARNTRIRKKQYVESLKLQVGEMLQAKAREERDARLESSKITAERTARRQMVLNMFYLKATEELSPRAWACVLDDGFTCMCPITPFRSFPPSEAREDHRLIAGIESMIQDTASLAVFIKSICPRSRNPTGRKLKYQFYTSPEDTVVGSDALMCQWLMKTDNATECGAQCEVFSHGMLRAYFSPDNRIKRLEIVFDVMSFMQQLQRAAGQGEFRMIPNTLAAAMQPSQQARLVLSADPPHGIAHANEAWSALMGHPAEEAKLFTYTLMKGPADANSDGVLEALVQTCVGSSLKRAEAADLVVVTRDMRRLKVAVQAYPLGEPDGVTTHLLLVMEEVPVCAPLGQGGACCGLQGSTRREVISVAIVLVVALSFGLDLLVIIW